MRRKYAIVALAIALVAIGVYRFGGVRIARDGSGFRPRFLSVEPNYDALEADRARQRQALPAGEPAVPARPETDAAIQPLPPPDPQPVDRPGVAGDLRDESLGAVAEHVAGAWPDFRGSGRDGRYPGPIRTTWPSEGLPLLWRQPIGFGHASFVAAEGRLFTIEQRREQETVAAYDLETGRELWTHGWDAEFVEWQGGDGPRATPTYHEGRLYALGALGELRCLDARTGALHWRRNILADAGASNLEWGMAASPLVVDDKVIVLPGGPRGRSVAAYDKANGEIVWTSLDDQQAYTSPMLATLGGVRQLVLVTAARAVGVTVEGGRLLWEYPWVTQVGINVAQPIFLGDDRVFLSAAYGHGAAVFELARAGETFTTRTIWQNTRMKNKFTSSVLHDGYIYGLDESILACIEAATGDLKWKGGRYGYGQILLAGGYVIVLTEDGDIALVKATPERHEEMARFPAIDGRTWNHPIIAGGRLVVRNLREMAAFDLRP